jgi:hypothetical protein
LDKPVIVGEFPTADTSYGLTDTNYESAAWYLNYIHSQGYAGELGWSLNAGDGSSNWGAFAPVFSNWVAQHGGSAPPPPPPDTVAPDVPVISSGAVVNSNEVLLTGTATDRGLPEPGDLVTIYDAASVLGTTTTAAGGSWSFMSNPLASGPHPLTATVTDLAGNVSAVSQEVDLTIAPPPVDNIAPTDTITRAVKSGSGTLTLSGSSLDQSVVESGDTVNVFDGTTNIGSTTVNSNGNWNFTTPALSSAVHTLTTTVTDAAGNVGQSSGAVDYAPASHQTLTSTGGNDIMLGTGRGDTFVFSGTNFGHDTVTNFRTGTGHDVIDFSQAAFSGFADVLAHAQQVGSNVVIAHDAANSVTLKNVALSHLTAADFHFV